MKRSILGIAITAALSGTAMAADIPVKAPCCATPVLYDWTGFYVGADAGYAWGTAAGVGTNAALVPGTGPTYSYSVNGGFGGGFIGAQKQWQNLVFGIEGDYQGASIKGTSPSMLAAGTLYTFSTTATWEDSIRGRLGFAADRWLVYGTAGWAEAHWKNSYGFTGAAAPFSTYSPTASGWTGGAGVDYAVTNQVFLMLEYRYSSFKAANFVDTVNNAADTGPTLKLNDIRGGVGFKF